VSEPERIIIENEVMWETRDRFRGELIGQLREGLESAAHKVEGGSEDGVTVVTDRGWRAALNRIEGQRLPPIDHHYAEVLTGAIITVWAKCPRCGIANSIAMSVDPVLTIDTHTAELKLKAKAKPRSHVCGQLTLMESGAQATLEVEVESLAERVHGLLQEVALLPGEEDGEDMPSIDAIRLWDRATIDQVDRWATAMLAKCGEPADVEVPPLPRVLGGEADPEQAAEDVISEDDEPEEPEAPAIDRPMTDENGDAISFLDISADPESKKPARKRAARLADRVIPAETTVTADPDDLLPGEDLGACPWPGCELAVEHPGAHQTAADDTTEPEGT